MLISNALASLVFEKALSQGADFAEIFVEKTQKSLLKVKNESLESLDAGIVSGLGLRLIKGQEQVYLHTNDMKEKTLLKLAQDAASALASVAKSKAKIPEELSKVEALTTLQTTKVIPKKAKRDFLVDVSKRILAVNPLIVQAMPSLIETEQTVQVLNSEGLNKSEHRSYTRLATACLAQEGSTTESGHGGVGRTLDFEYLLDYDLDDEIQRTAQQALTLLKAGYAPAGEFPVILNSGFGGVIFHEACGHGLETTSVAKGASVFCDQLGKSVASSCVTAIDDGGVENMWGSLSMDDEGHPTQKTVLIQDGILKAYMADRLGAQKMGIERTGSGRRQSYKFPPTSRMRNTYIAAGKDTLEDMVKDVDYGIFAKSLGGGSVTPGTGAFNFSIQEGYLVEKGEITQPIKGASLIGTGIETLKKITRVGKDLELAPGTCGSVSGWIPVTVGQPPLLVSSMTVGGRS